MSDLVFLDLDGTLIRHDKPLAKRIHDKEGPTLLPGVIEKIIEWERNNIKIIITTGRRESLRKITEQELESLGIVYDKLIMDCGTGKRYVINDLKPNHDAPTAIAINLTRNKGIGEVNLT